MNKQRITATSRNVAATVSNLVCLHDDLLSSSESLSVDEPSLFCKIRNHFHFHELSHQRVFILSEKLPIESKSKTVYYRKTMNFIKIETVTIEFR